MGLDISAYSNLEYERPVLRDSKGYVTEVDEDDAYNREVPWIRVYLVNSNEFDRLGNQLPGWYSQTKKTDSLCFRAGSYSGYNNWRDQLANMAFKISNAQTVWDNKETYINKPFYELIKFSDCEGVIGTEVAKKLYGDFKEFYGKAQRYAQEHPSGFLEGDYWLEKYEDWMEAFRLASENGVVWFH